MKYDLLESTSKNSLIERINFYLESGAELVGGICVHVSIHGAVWYTQAILRKATI